MHQPRLKTHPIKISASSCNLVAASLASCPISENPNLSSGTNPLPPPPTMATPHRFLLLLLPLLLATTVSAATVGRPLVGGWTAIADPNDPHVQGLGKYAVDEHNSQAGTSLVFVRVVSGQTQVVSGANYRLVITANDAGVARLYEAVVWEKPWENFRQLTSFQPRA